jgi:hypothetical protein
LKLRIKLTVAVLILSHFGLSAPADSAPPLALDEILVRMSRQVAKRDRDLLAYECIQNYRLAYSGFFGNRSAEMVVRVRFQSPDVLEVNVVSESGSEVLRNRVLHRIVEAEREAFWPENRSKNALDASNYRFSFVRLETTGNAASYVLYAEPLASSKFLIRGRIWVNAASFAVERVEAEPARNPSFWIKKNTIEQTYSPIHGFWLPARMLTASTIRPGGRAEIRLTIPTRWSKRRASVAFPACVDN